MASFGGRQVRSRANAVWIPIWANSCSQGKEKERKGGSKSVGMPAKAALKKIGPHELEAVLWSHNPSPDSAGGGYLTVCYPEDQDYEGALGQCLKARCW